MQALSFYAARPHGVPEPTPSVQATRLALASPSATVFVTAQEREQAIAELEGVLVVRVTLNKRDRHNLASAVRRAVDECLARVGLETLRRPAYGGELAGRRRRTSWETLAAMVEDAAQSQIVIALDGLSLLANQERRLDGEDSLTLRDLLASPLRLILDEEDQQLELFGPLTNLAALTGNRVEKSIVEASLVESLEGSANLDVPESTALGAGFADVLREVRDEPAMPAVPIEVVAEETPSFESLVGDAAGAGSAGGVEDEEESQARPSRLCLRAAMAGVFADPEPVVSPSVTDTGWRAHVLALEAARGPQSLAALEQLFVRNYLPLAEHLMRDAEARQPEARARRTFEEFRHNFSRVYGEAAHAFAARSKRPKMVLDAWSLAQKAARAHDARPVLLLIDGLRFDVGNRMNHKLRGVFECVHEEMLCAALPATTARQLELLARGPEGLALEHEPPSLEDVLRERTADSVRRIRAGSRDLFKLDVVETRLRGAVGLADVEDAAELAAHAVQRFISELTGPRRHLVYVFGDHGFPYGGSSLDQKGASPEQVFVPAAAYLTLPSEE